MKSPDRYESLAAKRSKTLWIELLAGADDALARVLAQLFNRPIVDRDAEDRTLQQAPLLEAVERAKRHDLGQVARDAKDDENVGGCAGAAGVRPSGWRSQLLRHDVDSRSMRGVPTRGEPHCTCGRRAAASGEIPIGSPSTRQARPNRAEQTA